VDLIEGNNPPGIFRLLDDTCKTVHALDSATCDGKFMEKVMKTHTHNENLLGAHPQSFTVKHYAGEVAYTVEEFCFKNYDNLYTSLVMCMQTSDNSFYLTLFPEDVSDGTDLIGKYRLVLICISFYRQESTDYFRHEDPSISQHVDVEIELLRGKFSYAIS
jgi:myosin heavy subunit